MHGDSYKFMGAEIDTERSFSSQGKIKNRIFQELLSSILAGEYEAGEKLTIEAVADDFQVSNTPVREALKELETTGILHKPPYKSYQVRDFNLEEVKDIFESRAALESYACQLAAERIEKSELEELASLHEKGKKYLEAEDMEGFSEYNRIFHFRLAAASHNEHLLKLYRNIQYQIMLFTYQVFETTDRSWQTIKEHELIIDRISGGKTEKARRSMEEHILNSWRKYEGARTG